MSNFEYKTIHSRAGEPGYARVPAPSALPQKTKQNKVTPPKLVTYFTFPQTATENVIIDSDKTERKAAFDYASVVKAESKAIQLKALSNSIKDLRKAKKNRVEMDFEDRPVRDLIYLPPELEKKVGGVSGWKRKFKDGPVISEVTDDGIDFASDEITCTAIRAQMAKEKVEKLIREVPESYGPFAIIPQVWDGDLGTKRKQDPDTAMTALNYNKAFQNMCKQSSFPPSVVFNHLKMNRIIAPYKNRTVIDALKKVNSSGRNYEMAIVMDQGWLAVYRRFIPVAVLCGTSDGTLYYFTSYSYFVCRKRLPPLQDVYRFCSANAGYLESSLGFYNSPQSLQDTIVSVCTIFQDLEVYDDQKNKAFNRAKFYKNLHPETPSKGGPIVRKRKIKPVKMKPEVGVFDMLNSVTTGVGQFVRSTIAARDFIRSFQEAIDTCAYDNKYEAASPLEVIMMRFEDFLSFYTVVIDCKSFKGVFAAILLYARTLGIGKSFTMQLASYMYSFAAEREVILEPESGECLAEDPDKFSFFLKQSKMVLHAWDEVKNSPFVSKLFDILGAVFTLQIAPKEWLEKGETTHAAFALLQEAVHLKVKSFTDSSTSMFEAVANAVLFLLERGYAAIKSGDISLLFYDTDNMKDLDKEYTHLVSAAPLVLHDKLEEYVCDKPFKGQQDYQLRLTELIIQYNKLRDIEGRNIKKNKFFYDTVMARIMKLKSIEVQILEHIRQSCVKEKPFGVLITGPSGIGKSWICTYLYKVICADNGIVCTDKHVVTINDVDQFDSEYEAHHTVVIMDDIANAKAETYKNTTPTAKVLKILNNVPTACLKAEAQDKGKYFYTPKVVMGTTNKKDLMARQFSNEPASILRRFDLVIDVRLRPNAMVDGEPIEYSLPDGTANPLMFQQYGHLPDIWDIRVQRVKIVRNSKGANEEYIHMDLLGTEENPCTNFDDVCSFVATTAKLHFAKEAKLVASMKDMVNCDLCVHHRAPFHCKECAKDRAQAKVEVQTPIRVTRFRIGTGDVVSGDTIKVSTIFDDDDDDASSESSLDLSNDDDSDRQHELTDEEYARLIAKYHEMKNSGGVKTYVSKRPKLYRESGDSELDGDEEYLSSNSLPDEVIEFHPLPDMPACLRQFLDEALSRLERLEQVTNEQDVPECLKVYYEKQKADFIKWERLAREERWAELDQEAQDERMRKSYKVDWEKPSRHQLGPMNVYGPEDIYVPIAARARTRISMESRDPIPTKLPQEDDPMDNYDDEACSWVPVLEPGDIIDLSLEELLAKEAIHKTYIRYSKAGRPLKFQRKIMSDDYSPPRRMEWLENICDPLFQFHDMWWSNIRWFKILTMKQLCHWKIINSRMNSAAYFAVDWFFNFYGAAGEINVAKIGVSTLVESVKILYKLIKNAFIGIGTQIKLEPEYEKDGFEVPTPVAEDLRVGVKLYKKLTPIVTETSKTTTVDTLKTLIQRHTGFFCFWYKNSDGMDKYSYCNAFPLKSDYWLMPAHAFVNVDRIDRYELRTCSKHTLGRQSLGFLTKDNICYIDGHDAAVVRISEFGDVWRGINYIAESKPSTVSGWLCAKRLDVNGDLAWNEQYVSAMGTSYRVVNEFQDYPGYPYRVPVGTQKGDCMSPIIAADVAAIIGFHLSGTHSAQLATAPPIGTSVFVPRNLICSAIDSLIRSTIKLVPHSSAPFPRPAYDMPPDSVLGILPERHCLHHIPVENATSVEYLGTHAKGSVSLHTSVRNYRNGDRIRVLFDINQTHFPPTKEFLKEENLSISKIWAHDIALISDCNQFFIPEYWNLAHMDMVEHWSRALLNAPSALLEQTRPYDLTTAINGSNGVAGLTRLDLSTSAGWHFSKPKSTFAVEVDPTPEVDYCVSFEPAILKEVEDLRSTLLKGERVNTIFRATIKDEALKQGKGKMRIFGSCDVAFSVLTRQYFSPIIRLMYHQWHDFEMAVGINAYGKDWHEMCERLNFMNPTLRKFIAGDYSNYDKTMSPQLIREAFKLMEILAEKLGYREEDLMIMRGIATEISNPIYEYDGCFIKVHGSNPSGNPLTVIINCVVNCFLNRYVFKCMYPDLHFADHVCLYTYGDDDIKTVDSEIPNFNYKNIQTILQDSRISWTDSHKSATLSDSLDLLEDIDFLKRKFVWHNDLRRTVAPLARASLSKMMFVYTSRTYSLEKEKITQQQSLCTYLREIFLYGREEYNIARERIELFCTECEYPFTEAEYPTYDDQLEKFDKYPPRNYNKSFDCFTEEQIEEIRESMSKLTPDTDTISKSECLPDLPVNFWIEQAQEWEIQSSDQYILGVRPPSDIINKRLTELKNIMSCNTQSYRAGHSEYDSCLQPEAEDTMIFTDSDMQMVDIGTTLDGTATAASDNLSLASFLSRPIKIFTGAWNPSTAFTESFNPWNSFLTQTRVSNKISNFKMLRGNLHLKFVINASKFHYGRIIAYYTPLPESYKFASPISNLSLTASPFTGLIRASQLPHIILDPTDGVGAQMVLPFLWPKDAIDLPTGEWNSMGRLSMAEIAPLKVIGGLSAARATISVFAWMTNVELHAPTTSNVFALSPQAGDEYSEGIISKPATVLSNLAGKLSQAPGIGPYARATQIAAGATAEVAKAFGYSRPIAIDQPLIVKKVATGQFATTNSEDTSVKMTVDTKQELTIDPRTVGAPVEDGMDIQKFCAKECMVAQFTWSETDTVGTQLMRIAVHPKLFNIIPLDGSICNQVFSSPAAYMSALFTYWRGKMRYKISVARSGFHVGRLRLTYDPVSVPGFIPDYQNDNVMYNWILDLQESNEAEVECGWTADVNYLRLHNSADVFNPYDVKVFGFNNYAVDNGVFAVYVEGQLITPNSTTDESVTVFIYASLQDGEYAVPFDGGLHYYGHVPLIPESGDDENDKPAEPTSSTQFAAPVNLRDHALSVFFGEKVSSFRQLLKRYTLSERFYIAGDQTTEITDVILTRNHFPPYAGGSGGPFPLQQSYAYNTPINWITPCFAAWRGAIRRKIVATGMRNVTMASLTVALGRRDDYFFDNITPRNLIDSPKSVFKNLTGLSGLAFTQESSNGTLEFELPYYQNSRFTSAQDLDVYSSFAYRVINPPILRNSQGWYNITTTLTPSRPLSQDHYVAAGEDFTTFMFLCTPIVYTPMNF